MVEQRWDIWTWLCDVLFRISWAENGKLVGGNDWLIMVNDG